MYGCGKIRHAGKNPTSRLKTVRGGRLLAYRKTGPDHAGIGLGSAPSLPPGQSCNLILRTVSLSQAHGHLSCSALVFLPRGRLPGLGLIQTSAAKPGARCFEGSGVHVSGMLWGPCPWSLTLISTFTCGASPLVLAICPQTHLAPGHCHLPCTPQVCTRSMNCGLLFF